MLDFESLDSYEFQCLSFAINVQHIVQAKEGHLLHVCHQFVKRIAITMAGLQLWDFSDQDTVFVPFNDDIESSL